MECNSAGQAVNAADPGFGAAAFAFASVDVTEVKHPAMQGQVPAADPGADDGGADMDRKGGGRDVHQAHQGCCSSSPWSSAQSSHNPSTLVACASPHHQQ
jgi:hypothetical protein